jgi:hypothetical protein
MRTFVFAALAMIGCNVAFTSAYSQVSPRGVADSEKKARIELASEFVRELEVLYGLQETAKKELAENTSTEAQLATGIRTATRTGFEMNTSINRLGRIALAGQWAKFRDLLTELHEQRIAIMQEIAKRPRFSSGDPSRV